MATDALPDDGSRTPSDKRWLWIGVSAVLVIAVTAWLWGQVRGPEPAGAGHRAPSFSAPVIGGGADLSLDHLRGRPVVLNFWASWCGPCKDEAPLLNKAYERYGNKVSFVGIDSHDARSDAAAFIKQNNVRYPSVFDEGAQIYNDYGLTGQPETFFIDADGTVVAHVPGELFLSLLQRDITRLIR